MERVKASAEAEQETLTCENASLKSEIEYLEVSQAQNLKELCEEKKANKQLVDELRSDCQAKQAELESLQKKLKDVEAAKQSELSGRSAEMKARLDEVEARKLAELKEAKERQGELQGSLEKVKCELKLADSERCRLTERFEEEVKKRDEELGKCRSALQRKDQEIQEIQVNLSSFRNSSWPLAWLFYNYQRWVIESYLLFHYLALSLFVRSSFIEILIDWFLGKISNLKKTNF